MLFSDTVFGLHLRGNDWNGQRATCGLAELQRKPKGSLRHLICRSVRDFRNGQEDGLHAASCRRAKQWLVEQERRGNLHKETLDLEEE